MKAHLVVLLVGCAKPSAHPAVDASSDADELTCTSAAGTANLVVHASGPAKAYDRLYAGGLVPGLVNGATGEPFELNLAFANESSLSAEMGDCCSVPGSSCCSIDSLAVQVPTLLGGSELGSHTANVSGMGFTTTGTLTITSWMHPADTPPGHITGSLSVTTNAVTIDGSFDNTFCGAMVGVSI